MKKYLSYFFRTTGPYQPALLLSVLCGIILALCSFCYVYVSKALVDVATGHALGTITHWALAFGGHTLTLSAFVNNLFNSLYYASGWRWEAYYFEKGKPRDLEKAWTGSVGVYPQAPAHFMLKASLAF